MQRTQLITKMLLCFNECKKMDYSDQQAMDRTLEVVEEALEDKIPLVLEVLNDYYLEYKESNEFIAKLLVDMVKEDE